MYFTAAAVFVLSLLPAISAAPTTKRAACSPLELVFARGTGDPGIVGPPLYSQVKRLVPGSTYHNVDYPAGIDFLTSAARGTAAMQQHIEARNKECPQMKFALSGYSQGVMVVHGLKLSAAAKNNVVAIAAFGDPYTVLGAAATWPINNAAGVYKNCASGDPVCGGGLNILAHLGYGGDATKAATFISQKLGAAGGAAGASGSTAATEPAAGAGGLLGGLFGGA